MRNKIPDLNNHLFEQLERLNNDSLTREQLKDEVDRAKAITQVASQIIQGVKVTVEAFKLVKGEISRDEAIKIITGNDISKLTK